MGYPLITFYLTGAEIKKSLEVITSIYPLKGADYYLQVSGVRFKYNPNRIIFDRVTELWIGSEEEGYRPLDYSRANKQLYRCASNMYNTTFLKIVGRFTWHLLDIVPKDRNGKRIPDLGAVRVDADKEKPGIQELKEWVGLIKFLESLGKESDRIPRVPEKYAGTLDRIVVEASWNPVLLLRNGTWLTWAVFAVCITMALALLLVASLVVKKLKV
jgi:5'-nucleotidase